MKLTELVNRGWTAMLRFDPSLPSGKETMLATKMPGWSAMSWAEQVSHRAAYGFDGTGELVIADDRLADPETRLAIESSTAVDTLGERFALPGREMPGADERLRRILQESSVPGPAKYDDSATVWTGEDRSLVYTCEYGWGMPDLVEREPTLYCEFSGKGDLHLWQDNYGQQPDWSMP